MMTPFMQLRSFIKEAIWRVTTNDGRTTTVDVPDNASELYIKRRGEDKLAVDGPRPDPLHLHVEPIEEDDMIEIYNEFSGEVIYISYAVAKKIGLRLLNPRDDWIGVNDETFEFARDAQALEDAHEY